MPVTLENSVIRFNDGSTQGSAVSPSAYTGVKGQVFTGNGTFTIPTGVTAVKVTVCGGGGGGSGGGWYPSDAGSGGTSSVSSGSQGITTISAGGGGFSRANGQSGSYFCGAGGSASGGDINVAGQHGNGYMAYSFTSESTRYVEPAAFDISNQANGLARQNSPVGIGAYGTAGRSGLGGANGGQAAIAIKYLTGLTPGATLSVTVGGAGGAGSNGGSGGANGSGGAGIVIFEW